MKYKYLNFQWFKNLLFKSESGRTTAINHRVTKSIAYKFVIQELRIFFHIRNPLVVEIEPYQLLFRRGFRR